MDPSTGISKQHENNDQVLDENLDFTKPLNEKNELPKSCDITPPSVFSGKNPGQMEKKCVKYQMYSLKELKTMLIDLPRVYKLIFVLKRCIRRKNLFIADLKNQLKHSHSKLTHAYTQTDIDTKNEIEAPKVNELEKAKDIDPPVAWNLAEERGEEKSIAEQVKEAAQSALSESGMVFVESAGMYYDYKTGYYYNSELGLYYHTDTSCYYSYSNEKQSFEFHSYPDTSNINTGLVNHERRKSRKHKQIAKAAADVDSLARNLSLVTLRTNNTLDSIVKHHPPCMRIIVKETTLPKLKVGSLFLITKDGGTVGREGAQHAFVLRDHNVSRNHLDIKYDQVKKCYVAIDLGSKNGSVLNGRRISESQVISAPVEIVHGSTLELGETKLLCHVHPGNDTCGRCEPGLLMEAEEKEKKIAYTRVCSIKKQHELELARLKNKYAPEPLAIEEGTYNDRAKARRETVGSTHGSEKTQQADLKTSIAEDNKGFKLLSKMGWSKGEGLGKDNQGETEPIPLVSNESKAGLGAAGSAAPVIVGAIGSVPLRVFNRKVNLRPPAKLFRDPLEEDDE